LQKNKYHVDKMKQRHKNEKDMLKIKIGREVERIKKEKTATLEQLHYKFKNRKYNLEESYKRQLSLQTNPIRAKSTSYKAPKLKNNSSVFSKLSSIDNYSVQNTNKHPEKINVNLNFSKQNTNQMETEKENNEWIDDGDEIQEMDIGQEQK